MIKTSAREVQEDEEICGNKYVVEYCNAIPILNPLCVLDCNVDFLFWNLAHWLLVYFLKKMVKLFLFSHGISLKRLKVSTNLTET